MCDDGAFFVNLRECRSPFSMDAGEGGGIVSSVEVVARLGVDSIVPSSSVDALPLLILLDEYILCLSNEDVAQD